MKVSIIGCGRVGTTTAYAIALQGLAKELVLVDIDNEKAQGEALDIVHGTAQLPNISVSAGGYQDTAGSDVVVVTAGIPRKPGESRLDLAKKNVQVVSDIVDEIMKVNTSTYILMVSNPVDIMTQIAYKQSELPFNTVFGLGNVLDQLRFESLLGEYLGIHPANISAMVVGEHGDSMVILEEDTYISGVPLDKYKVVSSETIEKIKENTIKGGAQVIQRKGGTFYSVALAICKVISAIHNDTKEVLPVCYYHKGNDTTYSEPTIIGKNGIEQVVKVNLPSDKQDKLQHSINTIRSMLDEVNF
ncbi:malate dehydrogenase [Proteinivorax hydrogeniformans]|uniref:Malate dehydrogenase n=1 Tax=Proteinivorax hydrogeniformans TaxID=1826727 RepID=A0AAU8HWD7_9FIRM